LCILATAATAAAAPKQPPPPAAFEDACLDDACKHHALDAFRAAYAAQRDGKAEHPLRISYFGDSLTADDHITHALRQKLLAHDKSLAAAARGSGACYRRCYFRILACRPVAGRALALGRQPDRSKTRPHV